MKVLVVTNMYPTPAVPALGTFVHDQVRALRAAGAEVDVFFVNGRQSRWNYLWAFPRFWSFLRGRRYDVIHAHYVLTGVIARSQWRHKVVLTHHGVEVLGDPPWQAWLCRLVTPLFDAAIYVTEELRRALDDTDGWVIPCGIDLTAFTSVPRDEARARLGLPANRRLVLFAGQYWQAIKRFDLVEAAIALAQEHFPDIDLVLLTEKPHEIVPLYMSACDALVLTSDAEGSPTVVKEAMASNLPIVSVAVGDVVEVIGDTPGCTVVERDPAAIAAGLCAVLAEPRRTDGRSRIDYLRHDRIAQRILDVYEHALQARSPAASTTTHHV